MARTIDPKEWERTLRAFDAQASSDMSQQQQLARLIQYLRVDTDKAAKVVERGLPVDLLIRREADGGAPGMDAYFGQIEGNLGNDVRLDFLTPLIIFSQSDDDLEALAWLLSQGAAPNMVITHGYDAAWVAMKSNALEAYDLLMNAGAAPGQRLTDGSRTTRLMDATVSRQVSVVSDLLARKADPNLFDSQGRLALHLSLRQDPYTQEDLEITQLLLFANTVLDFSDNSNVAPLDLMTSPEHVALLRARKAHEKGVEAPRPVMAPRPPAPQPTVQPEAPAAAPPTPSVDQTGPTGPRPPRQRLRT